MSSGVAVDDSCISAFEELKLGHKLSYIVYKMNDDLSKVIVEKQVDAGASYSEFTAELHDDACRYAVYDFAYKEEGGDRNKILFVLWSPDSSSIKEKMIYTSSKADFRKKLVGIGTEIQATDQSEIDYDTVLEKVQRV